MSKTNLCMTPVGVIVVAAAGCALTLGMMKGVGSVVQHYRDQGAAIYERGFDEGHSQGFRKGETYAEERCAASKE